MSKRRVALASSTSMALPAKRQRTDLNKTVEIAVAKQIRRNADIKYTDVSSGYANAPASGTIVSATSNLVRGTAGIDNFVGNTLKPTGFQGKFIFTTNNQNFSNVCVMVFQWFDASVPTITGILQNGGNSPQCVLSPVLVTNKSQINVLYDRHWYMAPTAGDSSFIAGQGGFTDKFYIPGSRLRRMKFNSGTSALQDGGIYVLYVTDDPTATFPQFAFYNRLSFMDD